MLHSKYRVAEQLSFAVDVQQTIGSLNDKLVEFETDKTLDFIGSLPTHRKNMTPIIPGVYSIGESNLGKFSREEVTAIRTATKLSTTNNIRTFKKLYFHDTIYYVQQTEDRKRSSSNCCYLVNGTMCYGMIKKFRLSPPLY